MYTYIHISYKCVHVCIYYMLYMCVICMYKCVCVYIYIYAPTNHPGFSAGPKKKKKG